jgi:hypothetical protein
MNLEPCSRTLPDLKECTTFVTHSGAALTSALFRWIPAYGHGGLMTTLLAACGLLLMSRGTGIRGPITSLYILGTAAALAVLAQLTLTTWYLFSPTYNDHIEASAASVAQYFRQGIPVYPDLGSYTFHGLLYGPLLPELNSLGYVLGSGVLASKLVGWAAAWAAIGLLLTLPGAPQRGWMRVAASAPVVYLLISFGGEITADRADSLLLLFATVAAVSVLRSCGWLTLVVLASLAGGAADLKVHGPVYLLPALYWWAARQPGRPASFWLTACAIAGAVGMVTAALPFIPANVSLRGYLVYLHLATKHGLEWREFGWNAAFLLSLWVPPALLLLASRQLSPSPLLRRFAAVLLAVEGLVCVIAAKPGAGLHHLIPFLGYHALLLQGMLTAGTLSAGMQERVSRGAVAALAAVLLGTAWPAAAEFQHQLNFDLELPRQEETRAELIALSNRYPRGMLGVSDNASYGLANFRPWLTLTGTRQTDYGALMDLKLSGVSDAPLALALGRCEIPFVFMPREGQPFVMLNQYDGVPLFSPEVRAEFSRHYALLETGRDFRVYGCGPEAVEKRPP